MKRNTTFRRMLLNNLLPVLLVGLVMLSLTMFYAVLQQRDQIQLKYETEIGQIQSTTDGMLSTLLSSCTRIAANRDFFITNNNSRAPSYELMKRLNDYFHKSISSDLILIYADESIPYFYSAVGSMSANRFDNFFRMENLPLEELRKLACTDTKPFLTETKVYQTQTIMYAFLCPLNNFADGTNALALFLIPQDTMQRYLHAVNTIDDRTIVISDSRNMPLITVGKALDEDEARLLTQPNADIKSGGRRFLSLRSSCLSWNYCIYYRLSGVTILSFLNVLSLSFSTVLLGLWIALYFTKRSFKPIGDIMQQYQLSGEEDAYTQLGTLIDSLLLDLDKSHTQTQMLKRSNCHLLLTGFYQGISEEEVRDIFELPDNADELTLLLIAPVASLPKVRSFWYQTTYFSDSGVLAVLAGTDNEETVRIFANELGTEHPNQTIVVSEPFRKLQDAAEKLIKLYSVLSCRFVADRNVLYESDIAEFGSSNKSGDNYAFLRMYQALLNRDLDIATAEASQQLKNLKASYTPDLQRQTVMNFYSVFSLCRTNFKENRTLAEACLKLRTNRFSHICELEQTVFSCLDLIRGQQEEDRTGLMPDKEQVLECINLHFTDQDFSLQSLADSFGMTASSMSRFVKAQMNTTLSDYVMKKRIALACTMLTDTQTSIRDIVEKVGYNDINNFYRRFKAVTGMTPAQYREQSNTEVTSNDS